MFPHSKPSCLLLVSDNAFFAVKQEHFYSASVFAFSYEHVEFVFIVYLCNILQRKTVQQHYNKSTH